MSDSSQSGCLEAPSPGLNSADVAERCRAGLTNRVQRETSRTFGEIVRANVFTRFNAILGGLLVVILIVGPVQDALFGIILVTNTAIGILQEVRAKRTLDRLSLLIAQPITVARDGGQVVVGAEDVVIDDLILLRVGDQVIADGRVLSSADLEIDEALLTGEAEPRPVAGGDDLRSGTVAVAGSGWYVATGVGELAYANRLAAEARTFTMAQSELRRGIDRILTITAWAMAPIGGLLLISQLAAHDGIRPALSATVAGTMSMVPEGLVLLTSMSLALSVLRLGRRQVLVQDLGAVELLARVDVVCFDKTGTLTDGSMVIDRFEMAADEEVAAPRATAAIGALAAHLPANATLSVLGERWPAPPGWTMTSAAPFSSARKWSGATFSGQGTWLIGAPEVLATNEPGWEPMSRRAAVLAAEGRRVVALASSPDPLVDATTLPDDRLPVALVVLAEQLRGDASVALDYFAAQGIAVKVISGDNPLTVQALAADAGVSGEASDARTLPEDPSALADAVERTTIFGRVVPEQKRAMVVALQSRGHTVAMTGDGVNDVLAIKAADLGVAVGSAAPATRSIARIVLLDGSFSTLPEIVHEGRRVIANVERVANLFVSKTVYAAVLSLATGIARWPFPFLPRHLSLIGSMTIGVPGFFLALGPDAPRARAGFEQRIARFAVPAGLVAATATFCAFAVARSRESTSLDEARTASTAALGLVGFGVLVALARPLTRRRATLVGVVVAGFALAFTIPLARTVFAIELPDAELFLIACGFGTAGAGVVLSPLVAGRAPGRPSS